MARCELDLRSSEGRWFSHHRTTCLRNEAENQIAVPPHPTPPPRWSRIPPSPPIGGLALQAVEDIDIKRRFFPRQNTKKARPAGFAEQGGREVFVGHGEIWLTVCKIGLEQSTQFSDIPQNGIGELAAGEIAVCGHGMAEAGFTEGWGDLVEESALLNCLEVFGSAGCVGLAKQLQGSESEIEDRWPVDPAWESPKKADDAYEAAIARLRELTREVEKYPLVFKENVSYGFRRNLWALKPTGIFLSIGSSLACTAKIVYTSLREWDFESHSVISLVLSVVFLVCWLVVIRRSWVRLPAFEYAKRLLGASFLLVDSKAQKGAG